MASPRRGSLFKRNAPPGLVGGLILRMDHATRVGHLRATEADPFTCRKASALEQRPKRNGAQPCCPGPRPSRRSNPAKTAAKLKPCSSSRLVLVPALVGNDPTPLRSQVLS